MKYYLKDHVTDEMLVAVGFHNNLDNSCLLRKYKTPPKRYRQYKNYVVSINKHFKNIEFIKSGLGIWEFDRITNDEKKNYIKDLLDLGYVKELEE